MLHRSRVPNYERSFKAFSTQPGASRRPLLLAVGVRTTRRKRRAKPKLWDGDWSAKIVAIDALTKLPTAQPTVIMVRTNDAQFETEKPPQNRIGTASMSCMLFGKGKGPAAQ